MFVEGFVSTSRRLVLHVCWSRSPSAPSRLLQLAYWEKCLVYSEQRPVHSDHQSPHWLTLATMDAGQIDLRNGFALLLMSFLYGCLSSPTNAPSLISDAISFYLFPDWDDCKIIPWLIAFSWRLRQFGQYWCRSLLSTVSYWCERNSASL